MYKLVVNDMGVLKSWSAGGSASVFYFADAWASAPSWLAKQGYHLMVLESLSNMVNTYGIWKADKHDELWKCECHGKAEQPPMFAIGGLLKVGILKGHDCGLFPKGTLFFERVKLVERVGGQKEIDKILTDTRRGLWA